MVEPTSARPEATPLTQRSGLTLQRQEAPPVSPAASLSAAALPLLAVGALIGWWAWERGAYFGVVFLPGAMLLLGLLAALLLFAPWPTQLRGPAAVSIAALFALSVWTLISALWSPAPDIAIEDAQRVLLYAVAFGLGVWLCLLLGERRMPFSLAPVVGAAGLVAISTLIVLWTSNDAAELLDVEATLRYPLGYRNAAAAFFIGAVFPMLVLSEWRELDWRLRGALLGTATLCLELAVLAQSRSSVFAILLAIAVLLAVHPSRLRILGWLALAALPAAAALPWLLDVFQQGGGGTSLSLVPLRRACLAMAVSSVISAAIGAAVARLDPSVVLSPKIGRRIGWSLAGLLAAVGVAGIIVIAGAGRTAGELIDDQIADLSAGTPDLSQQGTRFGLDLRSGRGDYWRVALADLTENPVLGEGAGGFRFSYLLDRDTAEQPEDPHSVELLMGSELGIPGLLLFTTFVVGAGLAALRARKLGSSAATLAAGSLSIGAYWLGHASVEWFWSYPALTLPVIFVVGAAAAPALSLRPAHEVAPVARRGLAFLAVLFVFALVPFFLSQRYTNHALDNWNANLAGAYADLGRARDLNPTSSRPLVAEAVIAEEAGDPARALAALAIAQERHPDEWTLYYLEARILGPIDPPAAARALDSARALNPKGGEIADLEGVIGKP